MRSALLLTTLILLLIALPARAAVNGLGEIGHSFQSDMRGGCEVAVGDTALSHIRQPAAPALHKEGRIDSKMTIMLPIIKYEGPLDSSTSGPGAPPNFSIGYVRPLPFGKERRLGLGVAVYSSMGGSTKFKNQYPILSGASRTETSSALTSYSCVSSLAYRVNEKFRVGVSPRVELVWLNANTIINGGLLKFGTATSVGAGYSLGVLYTPNQKWQLGASYKSPTWMTPLSDSHSSFTANGQKVTGDLTIRAFSMPQRLTFGAAYQARENWKLIGEVAYLPYRNSLMGYDKLTGLLNLDMSPGYKDFWVIDLGTDYELNEHLGVSCGYSFNTNPISRNRVIPIFVSNTQNSLTYGLRYKHGKWWAGIAHIIGLPAVSPNHGVSPLPGTPSLDNARVTSVVQSLTFGVGAYVW